MFSKDEAPHGHEGLLVIRRLGSIEIDPSTVVASGAKQSPLCTEPKP